MDNVLKAIGDPTRREILRIVWRDEMPAGDVAAHFAMSRPGVSQHLKVLKAAGLIDERRAGTQRLYRARPAGLSELRAYFEEFWNEGLAQLKAAAEEEQIIRDRKEGIRGAITKRSGSHRKGGANRRAS
ncbi:MAG: metalloregulator ArsR/SmtB family transcription factor [Dehalococcoidia bacterium]